MSEVNRARVRGRPRLGWMDTVGIGQQREDGGGCTTMREG